MKVRTNIENLCEEQLGVDKVDMCHCHEALFLGWGRWCATSSVLDAQFQDVMATDRSDENSRGGKGKQQFMSSKQDVLLLKVYPSGAWMLI